MPFPFEFPRPFPGSTPTPPVSRGLLPITGWWAELPMQLTNPDLAVSSGVTFSRLGNTLELTDPGITVSSSAALLARLGLANPDVTVNSSAGLKAQLGLTNPGVAVSSSVGFDLLPDGLNLNNPDIMVSSSVEFIARLGLANPDLTVVSAAGLLAQLNLTNPDPTIASSAGLLAKLALTNPDLTVSSSVGFSLAATGPTFDALGAGYIAPSYTASTTPDWLHDFAGNAAVVFVDFFCEAEPPTVAATIGGTEMTALTPVLYYPYESILYGYLFAFTLYEPPTGEQTVALSFSAGGIYDVIANSLSYSGATGFGTETTAEDSSGATSPAMSVSAASGQTIVQCFGGFETTFASYTQNQQWNEAATGASLAVVMGDAPGASSVSFAAAGTQPWGGIAVPIL